MPLQASFPITRSRQRRIAGQASAADKDNGISWPWREIAWNEGGVSQYRPQRLETPRRLATVLQQIDELEQNRAVVWTDVPFSQHCRDK